jgi:uncharacterized protein (TIGR04255 family)
MISRPAELPDFGSPPVVEVVLGVQFNSIENLRSPHLGLVWAEFKDEYPNIEEQPPLDPVFETFAEGTAATAWVPRIQLVTNVPTPRVFFINSAQSELLQVQRDRFLHNWRKVGQETDYPRFERMLETFEDGYRRIETLVLREKLGSIVPNQSELTYVNQIPLPANETSFEAFERLFGSFTKELVLDNLGKPEDARFLARYIIRDVEGTPTGRLYVTAEPAWTPDGTNIIQLTLVARGKPLSNNLVGVSEFLKIGRSHIVRAFAELTTDEMHHIWERKQ